MSLVPSRVEMNSGEERASDSMGLIVLVFTLMTNKMFKPHNGLYPNRHLHRRMVDVVDIWWI